MQESSDCIPTLPKQISTKKLEFSREKYNNSTNDKENQGFNFQNHKTEKRWNVPLLPLKEINN